MIIIMSNQVVYLIFSPIPNQLIIKLTLDIPFYQQKHFTTHSIAEEKSKNWWHSMWKLAQSEPKKACLDVVLLSKVFHRPAKATCHQNAIVMFEACSYKDVYKDHALATAVERAAMYDCSDTYSIYSMYELQKPLIKPVYDWMFFWFKDADCNQSCKSHGIMWPHLVW